MDQRAYVVSGKWATTLTPAELEVVRWFLSGGSLLDLARGTNRSRSTVTNLLARARKKMQAGL